MLKAQDSWKVYHNKTEFLTGTEESKSKNSISISAASLKMSGELVITYIEKKPPKDWSRFIAIFDGKDNELLQRKNARMLKVGNTLLNGLFKNNHSLYVYSWALPNDPDLASRIRIRRVHLCTIELK